MFVVNILILLYRIVAAIDAWNVARFLNEVDASGGGRLGRSKLPLSPLSVAGLLAVLIVIAGGPPRRRALQRARGRPRELRVHARARTPTCEEPSDTPDPDATTTARHDAADASDDARPDGGPRSRRPSAARPGTIAPELPAWDGKERLNILLVGVDQREGQSYFNTDTLIVASIDPKTNEVAMFQVPRDTVDVPVPANARNVWGSVYRGKINAWYANNRNRTDLWRGDKTQTRGFNALKALLGRAVRARHPLLRDGQLPGLPRRGEHAGRGPDQRPDPGRRERLPGRRRGHPGLHPGRPAAHERPRGADLRPLAAPRPGRRLRPRAAPAAGPGLAARADERAGRSWPT